MTFLHQGPPGKKHVVVVGAGIVGAATAFRLAEHGFRVTIIDAGTPGGKQACSYGNGAWISPASVVPMATPGIWRRIPGFLLDSQGSLTIRWRHLPRLTPWLARFVSAGATIAKVERTARALSSLLSTAPQQHVSLATAIGRRELICTNGLLYVYPDRASFQADALAWRLRAHNNVAFRCLERNALQEMAGALSDRYQFGVYVRSGAHCMDPGAYVAAITNGAMRHGAALRRTQIHDFEIRDGRLRAVLSEHGLIECDAAIIAAGISSKILARRCGDRIPLESERGYHAVLASSTGATEIPIMPSDSRTANTGTSTGFRVAGQVELACVGAPPDWRRARILLNHALRTFPSLAIGDQIPEFWMGHRPSTPDGLPVIGASRASPDILYAFGHGHVGLAASVMTAQIVLDLMTDRDAIVSLRPFMPSRFEIGAVAGFRRDFRDRRRP